MRTVFDESTGELVRQNPLAFLEGVGRFRGFEMSESGALMAVSLCVVGYCGGVSEASEDAQQELWVSRDGGGTWTRWASMPLGSWLAGATDQDVAVQEWDDSAESVRGWWVRSGSAFDEPSPIPAPLALTVLADWTWIEAQIRPDGSAVYYGRQHGNPLMILAVVDGRGMIEEVYGWPSADYVGSVVALGDGLFAGFSIQGGYQLGTDQLTFLIDLAARTVHPLLGLPDGEPGYAEPWQAIPLAAE